MIEYLIIGGLLYFGLKKKKSSIGSVDQSPVEKKFLHYLGDKDFELVEPFGGLWKSRGKKLYVRSKKNYNAAFQFLQRQPFVDKVQEAGGDNVICVTLK